MRLGIPVRGRGGNGLQLSLETEYTPDRGDLILRLRKIEGQVRGVQRMIESTRPPRDVLVQISAVRAALGRVGEILLEQHVRGRVADAMKEGDPRTAIEEVLGILRPHQRV